MRRNIIPIFLILPLLMAFQIGCSSKTHQPESATPAVCPIRAEVDENGNFTAIRTENNELGTSLDLNIWLHRKEEEYKLQLVIIYKGLDWLFAKPAEILVMTADGKDLELISSGRIELQSALARWWGMIIYVFMFFLGLSTLLPGWGRATAATVRSVLSSVQRSR